MEKTVVLDRTGKKTGREVGLSFLTEKPNEHAVYLDVKQHQAHQRQGTHKAKERGEIIGSTRKIKKQKGTGTARAGSIKSPLFRGGGTIFGPKPRNYTFKLNKKLKSLARCSALSYKAKSGDLIILEDFQMETPKTSEFSQIMSNLKCNNKKTLLVVSESNKNIYLSSRNLQGTKVVIASDVNTYDLVNASKVVVSAGALGKIEDILS